MKKEIAILCLSCQTERRGKQKSRMVLDGNQRESMFLWFHELPQGTRGPTITVRTAGCTNSSSHAVPPFTPSAQDFELSYGNPINDPRVHSYQADESCYELLCQVCCTQQGLLSLSFPPKHILCSATFASSSGRIDRSKRGAHQTPIAPLLLLLQGFSVLSSPSAQGNIWMQDLSIFPVNKMY